MNTFFVDQQQTPVFNAFEDIGNFVVFQQDLTTGEIRTNSAQYTKLFGFEPDIQLVFSKSCTSKFVITSYSIHYTKLYEILQPRKQPARKRNKRTAIV